MKKEYMKPVAETVCCMQRESLLVGISDLGEAVDGGKLGGGSGGADDSAAKDNGSVAWDFSPWDAWDEE